MRDAKLFCLQLGQLQSPAMSGHVRQLGPLGASASLPSAMRHALRMQLRITKSRGLPVAAAWSCVKLGSPFRERSVHRSRVCAQLNPGLRTADPVRFYGQRLLLCRRAVRMPTQPPDAPTCTAQRGGQQAHLAGAQSVGAAPRLRARRLPAHSCKNSISSQAHGHPGSVWCAWTQHAAGSRRPSCRRCTAGRRSCALEQDGGEGQELPESIPGQTRPHSPTHTCCQSKSRRRPQAGPWLAGPRSACVPGSSLHLDPPCRHPGSLLAGPLPQQASPHHRPCTRLA